MNAKKCDNFWNPGITTNYFMSLLYPLCAHTIQKKKKKCINYIFQTYLRWGRMQYKESKACHYMCSAPLSYILYVAKSCMNRNSKSSVSYINNSPAICHPVVVCYETFVFDWTTKSQSLVWKSQERLFDLARPRRNKIRMQLMWIHHMNKLEQIIQDLTIQLQVRRPA